MTDETAGQTPAGVLVYDHPQGSTITVNPDGSLVKRNAKGKITATSATAEKLAAGHGGWILRTGATPAPEARPAGYVDQGTRPEHPPTTVRVPMKFKQAPLTDLPRYVRDPEWCLQQKVDGIRAMLVVESGRGVWFRSGSGGALVSTTAAPVVNRILDRLPEGFVEQVTDSVTEFAVDGEIVDGAFWAFDFVITGQETAPLTVRLAHLRRFISLAGDAGLGLGDLIRHLPTAITERAKADLGAQVLTRGAEGWIAKRLDGAWTWGARVEHSLKIKVTHTVDCEVTGRNVGVDDNFVLAVRDDNGKRVEIGRASAIGKPNVPVGGTVEVKYLYAGAGGRLVQPTVLRDRTGDKAPEDCTADQLVFADKAVIV